MSIAHRPAARRAAQPRSIRERGVALVEFVLVVPFVVLLIGGTFDYGMAWRSGLATGTSVRAGARVGSSLGPDPTADYYVFSAVRASMASSGLLSDVRQVIVYRSDTADGDVPAGCRTGSPGAAKCDVIDGAQLQALSAGQFDSTGCMTAATTNTWCPVTRDNDQDTAEYLGVYVLMRRTFLFRITGSGLDIDRTAVMRLEPAEKN